MVKLQDNYKAGIFFIIIASFCIALAAVAIKQLRHLPLIEIIFFRNIPTMIIVPIILKRMNISPFGNNKPFLWTRGLTGVLAMLATYYTFTVMPLTDATTIHQLRPFFIFFFSGIFLKEKIYSRQIPFYLLAFLGGLLVIKPGVRIDIFPAIIAILAAIFGAFAHITLRHLRLTDHYLVIINYFAYISGLISLQILLFQKSFVIPNLFDFFILFLLGLFALGAQIYLTKAYQLAPANLVSLYTYSQIIIASIFGLLFFKEIPDIYTAIGASFIIISGYLNYRFKKNN